MYTQRLRCLKLSILGISDPHIGSDASPAIHRLPMTLCVDEGFRILVAKGPEALPVLQTPVLEARDTHLLSTKPKGSKYVSNTYFGP